MATVRNSLSAGVSTALFTYLFASDFSLLTLFGVNAFGFSFNLLGGNLRHSQIPFGFGWLEHILISPKQHQIHHSANPEHYDLNFGVGLSIWDRMFGSFKLSSEVTDLIKFGLSDRQASSLWRELIRPFRFPQIAAEWSVPSQSLESGAVSTELLPQK